MWDFLRLYMKDIFLDKKIPTCSISKLLSRGYNRLHEVPIYAHERSAKQKTPLRELRIVPLSLVRPDSHDNCHGLLSLYCRFICSAKSISIIALKKIKVNKNQHKSSQVTIGNAIIKFL